MANRRNWKQRIWNRRNWIGTTFGAVLAPLLARAQRKETTPMYGLIGKLVAVSGKRDELIALLLEGTQQMPGCLSYIVAKDAADENLIWVTEVWDRQESHRASLALPAVKEAIAKARPLLAGGERVSETQPIHGVRLPAPR